MHELAAVNCQRHVRANPECEAGLAVAALLLGLLPVKQFRSLCRTRCPQQPLVLLVPCCASDAAAHLWTLLPACPCTPLSTLQGEAVPMSAGDELLILYKGGYTPLEAFLKFGFVADEWWQ